MPTRRQLTEDEILAWMQQRAEHYAYLAKQYRDLLYLLQASPEELEAIRKEKEELSAERG